MSTVVIDGVRRQQAPFHLTWTEFFQRRTHPAVRRRVSRVVREVNGDRHTLLALDLHGRVVASRAFDAREAARVADSLAHIGLPPGFRGGAS